jgi:hypothetical protein
MPNQALEQTRDSVLRYGEVIGCELLNFFVRQQEAQSQSRGGMPSIDVPARLPSHRAMLRVPSLRPACLSRSAMDRTKVSLCLFVGALVVSWLRCAMV